MEGRGGGLGCLEIHWGECSHLLLLLCTCGGMEMERGILFQGWEWMGKVYCKLLGVEELLGKEEEYCKLLGVGVVDCNLLGLEVEALDCKLLKVDVVDCKL